MQATQGPIRPTCRAGRGWDACPASLGPPFGALGLGGGLGGALLGVYRLVIKSSGFPRSREKQVFLLPTFLLLHRGKPPLMTAQPCYTGGPWLWFPSICKETKENCHLKKKIKNQGSEVQVTLPRAHSCLDTGPVSAGDGEEHPSVHGRRGNSLRCL